MNIMGSLKLDNLKSTGKANTGYTYVDLHLDIEENSVPTRFTSDKLKGKDIKVDYDVDAIMNSLNNIFKTVPGERFLVPRFGANLRKYLFDPVSESVASRIGYEVKRAIQLWEPRVNIEFINVIGRPEQHEYELTIVLTILAFKQEVTFNSILNQDTDVTITNLTRVCPT